MLPLSMNRIISIASLMFVSLSATAATNAQENPPPPSPQQMHAKLEQISKDPASLSAAVRNGEKAASVCRHCHGAGGNSVLPDVPNLASQNDAYLLEQMNKFVSGQRKSSAFMEGMIKALTPDERIQIALFLSRQPVTLKPASSTAQSSAGKQLFDKLCTGCHGNNGAGTEKIPRLAGQQVQYVEDSLKRYRSGTGERIDPRMAAYTRNLKDADIQNLAAYVSTMP
jgi:cbb3-type cytochrome c oxidase subunit III